MNRFDVCIQGAGPVGTCLALALSRQGLAVALRGASALCPVGSPQGNLRTYALNARSVELLQQLKIWQALPADAKTAVLEMHVAGDREGAALRFAAQAQGLEELAWIVDAAELESALAAAVRFAPHVELVDTEVSADLTAYADGRDSASRQRLGVHMPVHRYEQAAVAARLDSDRPHQGLARQWFRSPDVLALLPFDRPQVGRSYGLVWSVPSAYAKELLATDQSSFESALNDATGGAAGRLALASDRASWPLLFAQAETVCGEGWVLLGDAAHVVHPLAGQGLNLGLADVSVLARTLAERESFRSLGDAKLLRRFARARALPVRMMGSMTDGLLELFSHPHPAVRELRNRGLSLLNGVAPLKRLLTERALRS